MKDLIVIGISTGARDVETWFFKDDELCKKFCESLVRETGHTVWVIEGTIIGRYELQETPVNYIEGNRFKS